MALKSFKDTFEYNGDQRAKYNGGQRLSRRMWCGRGDSNSHFQRKPDFAYQLRLSPPSLAEKSARAVCGLDFLITLPLLKRLRWMPSSLYTFPEFYSTPLWAWLGISNTATCEPSPSLTSSLVQFPITRTHN